MSGDAINRVVEAFFRRWPFYVALLAASMALGLANVSRTVDSYTSSGAIFVDNQSLLKAQSGVGEGGFFSYLTPAQFTSQELNGLISTDIFMESAMDRAGVELPTGPIERSRRVSTLRQAVSLRASSENLVRISVTTPDPALSEAMANALIDEFVQFQINVDIAESNASENFFADLVLDYQQDLVSARGEVDSALRGVERVDELAPDEQRELERLQQAEVLAAQRYQAAVQDVEASRLASLQTETDVRQSYSVFDPPEAPSGSNSSLLEDISAIASFVIVGIVLSLVGPIVSAMVNRTVVFPADLKLEGDVKVVALVPKVRRGLLRVDKAPVMPPPVEGLDEETEVEGRARQTVTFMLDNPDVVIPEPVAETIPAETAAPVDPRPAAPVPATAQPVVTPAPATPEPAVAAVPVPAPAAETAAPPVDAAVNTINEKSEVEAGAAAEDPVVESNGTENTASASATNGSSSNGNVHADALTEDVGNALMAITDLNDLDWDGEDTEPGDEEAEAFSIADSADREGQTNA